MVFSWTTDVFEWLDGVAVRLVHQTDHKTMVGGIQEESLPPEIFETGDHYRVWWELRGCGG